MAPEQQRPGEEARVSQVLGYAQGTQQQGFSACYHAAHTGAWEKNHVEILAGMKLGSCRSYSLKSFKF